MKQRKPPSWDSGAAWSARCAQRLGAPSPCQLPRGTRQSAAAGVGASEGGRLSCQIPACDEAGLEAVGWIHIVLRSMARGTDEIHNG